jgi:endonuclease YncB( thermonuclease family)
MQEVCEYGGRTYKYGADAKTALETMVEPVFPVPMDPVAMATRTEVRIWEKQVDEQHVKRGTMLAKKLKTAYSLI